MQSDVWETWALRISFFLSLTLGSFWVTGHHARAEESRSKGKTRATENRQALASSQSEDEFTLKGWDRFGVNYFLIFYGPSIGEPSSLQPKPDGTPDPDRPLLIKNFGTLSYAVSRDVGISGTIYWMHQPVLGQVITMRDPYVRVSHDRLIKTDNLTLYGDARVHFGLSDFARSNDLLTGFQTFQVLTYDIPGSRLQLGTYGSARLNVYGSQGFGPDVELYVGPNLSYRLGPTVELTLLYEAGMSHFFGDPAGRFYNDGTDLEPGVRWQITPTLMVNPYLNLYTGDRVNLASTSFGMMLNWTLL
jgi:hypothetical protein